MLRALGSGGMKLGGGAAAAAAAAGGGSFQRGSHFLKLNFSFITSLVFCFDHSHVKLIKLSGVCQRGHKNLLPPLQLQAHESAVCRAAGRAKGRRRHAQGQRCCSECAGGDAAHTLRAKWGGRSAGIKVAIQEAKLQDKGVLTLPGTSPESLSTWA